MGPLCKSKGDGAEDGGLLAPHPITDRKSGAENTPNDTLRSRSASTRLAPPPMLSGAVGIAVAAWIL